MRLASLAISLGPLAVGVFITGAILNIMDAMTGSTADLTILAWPTVILPTYNECENIVPLVQAIRSLPQEVAVLVIDDNSPDGTGALADQLAAEMRGVYVMHRAGKLGLGTAYVAGFHRLLASDVELILTMDADFSHHPRYIPALLDVARRYDMSIGSRYVPGGGTRFWGIERQLLSRTANAIARSALGLAAHDCTAGFRCYHRNVLEGVDFDAIKAEGYSFLLDMLYRVQLGHFTVGETPIIFEDRRLGVSKISKREIFGAMQTVGRLSSDRVRRLMHLPAYARGSH
jgi:dolichol-phosphate mannosyltransferase